MKAFENKNFLIFAGTSTIAESLIERLKIFRVNVIFTSTNQEKAEIIKNKFGYDYLICDTTDFVQVEEVFKKAKEKLGNIDGVANFSGSILIKAAHQTSYDEYLNVVHKNLTSCFAVTKAAPKYMDNGGSVLLISSIAAQMGISNHEAIAAAKGGVEALVRSAACTYAAKNIRFNAVAPSLTATNLSKNLTSNETMLKASEAMHALNRIGKAEDIARACSFLLNPDNSWITGQIITVDGGFSLKNKVKI